MSFPKLATLFMLAALMSACGGSRSPSGTDLVVSGTGPTEQVAGGATATFTMTVTNSGTNEATDINVVNTVGNQLALQSISCTASGGAVCPEAPSVVMNIAALPSGASLTFVVSATVGATANAALTNTMTATLNDDIDRTNNSATAQAAAYSLASSVSVTSTAPASAVAAGQSASFTMTVANTGPDAASGVRIVNTVGSNLTLTAVTCGASAGGVCPPTLGPVMDVPTLAVGAALDFYVSATVAPGTNGTITNTLTATSDNDTDRTDNTAVAVGSAASHNLSVTGTAPAGPLAGGATAVFGAVVSNAGPSAAYDVAISNAVNPSLTLGAIGCVASGGAVCPATTGATMVAPVIPVNGALTFSVTTTVLAGANGSATNLLTVDAAGDSRAADDSAAASVAVVSADLGVSQTGAASVAAGTSAVFTAVIANASNGPANNLTISQSLSRNYGVTVTCTASTGAVCPATLGPVMTSPSLPAGRFLTLTFTAAIPAADRGSLVSTLSVSGDGDPHPDNNTATVTTALIDARSGVYKAYAADGRQYDLTIDFDLASYTMSGSAQSVQRSFGADAGGGGFTVGGESRFRVAQDLLVGGHDFGSGVLPYVAARNFATVVGQLAGSYNLATRNVGSDGAGAVTRPGTARVSGNVLQVCQSDDLVEATQQCGVALKNYPLTVSGDVFTGIETTTNEVYSFRLARSGAATILLSAGTAPDATLQLRIGLPESSGLIGGTLAGASTSGEWVSVLMSPSTYSFAGPVSSNTFGLQLIGAQGPFALLQDANATTQFDAQFYVLQASPLAVMIGDFDQAASGLMQISLP